MTLICPTDMFLLVISLFDILARISILTLRVNCFCPSIFLYLLMSPSAKKRKNKQIKESNNWLFFATFQSNPWFHSDSNAVRTNADDSYF